MTSVMVTTDDNKKKVTACDSDPRHEEPKSSFEVFKASTRFLYAERDPKHGHVVYALCNRCDSTIGFEVAEPLPQTSLIW